MNANNEINPAEMMKAFRKYSKGLVIDFVIEINMLTVASYLFLMFQIPAIGAPIYLCIGFLLFYDIVEIRHNIQQILHKEQSFAGNRKSKHVLIDNLLSVAFKITFLVLYQNKIYHFIILALPAWLMLCQRLRIYCIYMQESECLNIINIVLIIYIRQFMVASRLLILLATISISLKVDGIVGWPWNQAFWFFWVFFSLSIGINFGLMLMIISKLVQLCLQRQHAKPEECMKNRTHKLVRAIVWFTEFNLIISVGAYLWLFGTYELIQQGSSSKLMLLLIILVVHFCLQAVLTTCWFDSVLETLIMLLYVDDGSIPITTMDTVISSPPARPPVQLIPTPRLLQRISSTYFGIQPAKRRSQKIIDAMSKQSSRPQGQDPQTDRHSLILQMGSRRMLSPASGKVLEIQSRNESAPGEAIQSEPQKYEKNGSKQNLHTSQIKQDSNRNCLICFEKPPNGVYMNCGHGGLCYDCALDLWDKNNQCYLCRQPILQLLEIDIAGKENDFIKVLSATQAIAK